MAHDEKTADGGGCLGGCAPCPNGPKKGSLFLFNVQAHGIEDQDDFNADSRIVDGDLVEGGQLLFLTAP